MFKIATISSNYCTFSCFEYYCHDHGPFPSTPHLKWYPGNVHQMHHGVLGGFPCFLSNLNIWLWVGIRQSRSSNRLVRKGLWWGNHVSCKHFCLSHPLSIVSRILCDILWWCFSWWREMDGCNVDIKRLFHAVVLGCGVISLYINLESLSQVLNHGSSNIILAVSIRMYRSTNWSCFGGIFSGLSHIISRSLHTTSVGQGFG